MDLNLFTVEEENFICCFDVSSRTSLIDGIKLALPHLEEPELHELANAAVIKLSHMTDADFAAIQLHPAYHNEDDD